MPPDWVIEPVDISGDGVFGLSAGLPGDRPDQLRLDGPSAAILIAEMPGLGRMTAGEVAAMTGLASVPHDSGGMRGRRTIAGGRRALRHMLFKAALAAACRNPVLKTVARRPEMGGKPHKLVIIAIARRLATIANAILKAGMPWQANPIAQTQLLEEGTKRMTPFGR